MTDEISCSLPPRALFVFVLNRMNISSSSRTFLKHNRLNLGRIAPERLVGALINCSLLQSGVGGGEGVGEPKWDSEVQ